MHPGIGIKITIPAAVLAKWNVQIQAQRQHSPSLSQSWYNTTTLGKISQFPKIPMPDTNPTNTKLCPTCGTRLSENATRCLVCGSEINPTATSPRSAKPVQGTRMPEITVSLPAALGLLALFIAVGAALVFYTLRSQGKVVDPTPTVTVTLTPTLTITPTVTETPTIAPTFTALPPSDYTVVANDTCSSIAGTFKISVNSIILLNNLPVSCTLYQGQKLKIPQPTPTPSPMPTETLNPAQATEAACQKIDYTVQANDTLSKIANNYQVSMAAIRSYNALPGDMVYEGQAIKIPLCERLPTPGPTSTPTPPPPYPAPNLLLPADGTAFSLADDIVTLQWASIGSLRSNESYAVIIEDLTEGSGQRTVEYVTDTKFIVPATLRPNTTVAHIFRWSIVTVRTTGSDSSGTPIYEPAGAASSARVFSWSGVSAPATPTP
jgi:LysM repeat protein